MTNQPIEDETWPLAEPKDYILKQYETEDEDPTWPLADRREVILGLEEQPEPEPETPTRAAEPGPWQPSQYGFKVRPVTTHTGKTSYQREGDLAIWYGPEQKNRGEAGWFNERGERVGAEPPGRSVASALGKALTTPPTLGDLGRAFLPRGYDPSQHGALENIGTAVGSTVSGVGKALLTPFQAGAQLVGNLATLSPSVAAEIAKSAGEGYKSLVPIAEKVLGKGAVSGGLEDIGKGFTGAGEWTAQQAAEFRKGINQAVKDQSEWWDRTFGAPSAVGELAGSFSGPMVTLAEKGAMAAMRALPAASGPMKKALAAGVGAGVASELATPIEVGEGQDYGTEKGKRMQVAVMLGAGFPLAGAALSTAKRTLNATINTIASQKGKGVFSQLNSYLESHPEGPQAALVNSVRDWFDESEKKSRGLFQEAFKQEGHFPVDKASTMAELEALKNSMERQGANQASINWLDGEIQTLNKMDWNVKNVYNKSKEATSNIQSFFDLINHGRGSANWAPMETRLQYKNIMKNAYRGALPKGDPELSVMNKKAFDLEDETDNIITGALEDPQNSLLPMVEQATIEKAKGFWSQFVSPIRGTSESAKALQGIRESEITRPYIQKILNGDKEFVNTVYNKLDEKGREAVRMNLLFELKEMSRSSQMFGNTRRQFEKRSPAYKTFFKGDQADRLDDLEYLMKITDRTAYGTSAGTAFILSQLGLPHLGWVGTAGQIAGAGAMARFAPKKAVFAFLGSDKGQAFLRSLRGKEPNFINEKLKQMVMSGRENLVNSLANMVPENMATTKSIANKLNLRYGPVFREAGLKPINGGEIARRSAEIEHAERQIANEDAAMQAAEFGEGFSPMAPREEDQLLRAASSNVPPVPPAIARRPGTLAAPTPAPEIRLPQGEGPGRGEPLPLTLESWQPGLGQPVWGPPQPPRYPGERIPYAMPGPAPEITEGSYRPSLAEPFPQISHLRQQPTLPAPAMNAPSRPLLDKNGRPVLDAEGNMVFEPATPDRGVRAMPGYMPRETVLDKRNLLDAEERHLYEVLNRRAKKYQADPDEIKILNRLKDKIGEPHAIQKPRAAQEILRHGKEGGNKRSGSGEVGKGNREKEAAGKGGAEGKGGKEAVGKERQEALRRRRKG